MQEKRNPYKKMTHKNIIKKWKKNNIRRLLNNCLRKDDKLKSVTSVTDVETQKTHSEWVITFLTNRETRQLDMHII